MDFLSSRPAEGGERQKPAAAQQRANLPAATLSLSLSPIRTHYHSIDLMCYGPSSACRRRRRRPLSTSNV